MGNRYAMLVGGSQALRDRIKDRAKACSLQHVTLNRAAILLFVEDVSAIVPIGAASVVLGALYPADDTNPRAKLLSDLEPGITRHRGAPLMQSCWGGYVAILANAAAAGVDILRAPFGELPCLYIRLEDAWLVVSDVAMIQSLTGWSPEIAWDALARFLGAPDARRAETCLAGLSEIRGGDRLSLCGANATVATLWSPWDHADRTRQLVDADEARQRLHETVMSCVAARGEGRAANVILLSGGLDSSILAAAAAAASLQTHCATVHTADPSGDERRYARLVAARTGQRLTEHSFDKTVVDLAKSGAAGLPRPVARAFEYEARRQGESVATANGARLIFSGGGGDNVFCSLRSITPLLDCLEAPVGRSNFWGVAHDLSDMTGTSVVTIVRRTVLRLLHRSRPLPLDTDLRYLSADAVRLAMAAPRHPWLDRPSHVPIGKGSHVALLLGTQGLTEDSDPQAACALLYPLLSQPVVELCLRIPTWCWFDNGHNRAVARHAFAQDLPREVIWRRSKGSPDSFVVELYESNRALIREMLMEGNLMSHGLLDRTSLAHSLNDSGPPKGEDHGRLMRLVDIEAWSRCWPG